MRRLPSFPSESQKNQNINNNQYINNNNIINHINESINDSLPSEEEIYKHHNLNNQNKINFMENNNIMNENFEDYDDDTDENIQINMPRTHLNPFNNKNKIYINMNNSIKNKININNNNINRINSKSQSYLDKDGNIIYKNNNQHNNIINRNSREPQLIKLDSHRIKVGDNEFEDLTKEAREIQNKEAFEKKILGITKEKFPEDTVKKPFLQRIGDFLSRHEDGFYAFIDGIGCILLHGPSIQRTFDRIDRLIDNWDQQEQIENNDDISPQRKAILAKNKDYETIMKFIPVWEVRENKRSDNNNNCIICLYDFNIGDKIAALPCLHVFHFDCIKHWLNNELSCPVCKLEVTLTAIIGENNY